MIQIDLTSEDLHAARFAYSPLVELSTSYRMLRDADVQRHFSRWMDAASQAVQGLELPYLETLIPKCGYIPDFLTPTPTRTDLTIEDELQKLVNTPTEMIHESIFQLINLVGDSEVRRQYLVYPREMIQCLVDDLRLYWQRALEPHWMQFSSILEGDILYRARQLAIDGVEKVFSDLSPVLTLENNQIQIRKPGNRKYHFAHHDIAGRGIQLVPTAFVNEKVWWQVAVGWSPMIIYGARGIGQWQQRVPVKNQSLEMLMGEGRASVLQALTTPASTSELAHRLMLTAGAVSQHLDRLHKTGLVEPHRSGRRVYYHLTLRGDQLLKLFA